jgi:hypothetical protein
VHTAALPWMRASVADGGGVCEPERIGTHGSKQSGELIDRKLTELNV